MNPGSGRGIGLAIMTWAGLAGANEPAPAAERGYSLEYRGAPACPDAAALAQAIEARTPGALQEPRDRAAVKLRVELREDGTSSLWIDLPEGGSRREFPQVACADALASIAVIASMVLEADVTERVATTQSLLERFEAVAAPAPAPERKARPVAAPVDRAPPPPTPRVVGRAAPSPKPTRARVAFTAGGLFESAVTSDAALGASAGVAAWLEPGSSGVWRPHLHAEILGTVPSTIEAEQGDVELRLVAGRLHLCPLSVPVSRMLRLVPCFSGDYGDLRARGTGDTVNPRTRHMRWLALGGTLRAQLALGRVVALESWLGLRGLTQADTFGFKPNIPAYEVPRWSLGVGLGIAITLP